MFLIERDPGGPSDLDTFPGTPDLGGPSHSDFEEPFDHGKKGEPISGEAVVPSRCIITSIFTLF